MCAPEALLLDARGRRPAPQDLACLWWGKGGSADLPPQDACLPPWLLILRVLIWKSFRPLDRISVSLSRAVDIFVHRPLQIL